MRARVLAATMAFLISFPALCQFVKLNSGVTAKLTGIYFTDSLNGVAVGYGSSGGVILHSINGGTNWTKAFSSLTDSFYCVGFVNADTGFVLFAGGCHYAGPGVFPSLKLSTDWGKTWQNYAGTLPSSGCIRAITFENNIGYLTGTGIGSFTWKSTDHGGTWSAQAKRPDSLSLYDVSFSTQDSGYVVGDKIDSLGQKDQNGNPYHNVRIYRTSDGGTTFNDVTLGAIRTNPGYYHSVMALWGGYSIAGGSSLSRGLVNTTTTGGISWSMGFGFPAIADVMDVWMLDKTTGYTAVKTSPAAIYKTLNGGQSWSKYFTVPNGANPVSIFILNDDNAWFTCDNGDVYGRRKITTAVNGLSMKKPDAEIYPNPVTDNAVLNLEIPFESHYTISLSDLNGKTVGRIIKEGLLPVGNLQVPIDLSSLRHGFYILKIESPATEPLALKILH